MCLFSVIAKVSRFSDKQLTNGALKTRRCSFCYLFLHSNSPAATSKLSSMSQLFADPVDPTDDLAREELELERPTQRGGWAQPETDVPVAPGVRPQRDRCERVVIHWDGYGGPRRDLPEVGLVNE